MNKTGIKTGSGQTGSGMFKRKEPPSATQAWRNEEKTRLNVAIALAIALKKTLDIDLSVIELQGKQNASQLVKAIEGKTEEIGLDQERIALRDEVLSAALKDFGTGKWQGMGVAPQIVLLLEGEDPYQDPEMTMKRFENLDTTESEPKESSFFGRLFGTASSDSNIDDSEISRLKSYNRKLVSELVNVKRINQDLEYKVGDLEADNGELMEKNKRLVDRIERSEARIAELTESISEMQAKFKNMLK